VRAIVATAPAGEHLSIIFDFFFGASSVASAFAATGSVSAAAASTVFSVSSVFFFVAISS